MENLLTAYTQSSSIDRILQTAERRHAHRWRKSGKHDVAAPLPLSKPLKVPDISCWDFSWRNPEGNQLKGN